MIFKLFEFSFHILKYMKFFLSEKRKYVFDYFQILLLAYYVLYYLLGIELQRVYRSFGFYFPDNNN